MAEVMNRAARRAAGFRKVAVPVRNQIHVVPMEHVESYFTHEIASEGKWRSNATILIIQPKEDAGKAPSDWFTRTLERMRESRVRKGTIPLTIDVGGVATEIDIGLVDIVVFFQIPPGNVPALLKSNSEPERFFQENLRHVDLLCKGTLHDQMIMAASPHFYRSDGSILFHCHNVIFGLRQEIRGDIDILAPLDFDPLLKALAKTGPLRVLGGMKQ